MVTNYRRIIINKFTEPCEFISVEHNKFPIDYIFVSSFKQKIIDDSLYDYESSINSYDIMFIGTDEDELLKLSNTYNSYYALTSEVDVIDAFINRFEVNYE